MSAPSRALGDHWFTCWATRRSQRIIVEWDFPKERPVARTPHPSVRTLIAAETIVAGVLSLAMGVWVRSLNRLLQVEQRYRC